MNPKLTIVIPYYLESASHFYVHDWIPKCIESEIILIQDLHPGATSYSLDFLPSQYPQISIKHIQGYFGNPGMARNAGLELATGTHISFWDIDDLPEVDSFFCMFKEMLEVKADIGVGQFTVKNYESEGSTYLNSNLSFFALGINPGLWRWIFSSKVIRNYRFKEMRLGEDQEFLQRLNVFDYTMYPKLTPVYQYSRGISTQLTAKKFNCKDLFKSVGYSMVNLFSGGIKSKGFRVLLIARQIITLFKICFKW